jgi:hypothetical protein
MARWSNADVARHFAKMGKLEIPEVEIPPDEGPEADLQRKIGKWCKDWGRPCLNLRQSKKLKGLIPAGWPDLAIIMPPQVVPCNWCDAKIKIPRVLFIELKSKTGRKSNEQFLMEQQFRMLGQPIYLVKSYRHFLNLVEANNG